MVSGKMAPVKIIPGKKKFHWEKSPEKWYPEKKIFKDFFNRGPFFWGYFFMGILFQETFFPGTFFSGTKFISKFDTSY